MIAACSIQGEKVLFFVIGLPGPLTDWCETVVAGLAEALGGRVARTALPPPEDMLLYRPAVGTLDQVALSLIEDSPAQLVVGARQPDDRLRTALVKTAVPFIVALDDPRAAAIGIRAKAGCDPAAATRAVANCCPSITQCMRAPGALALRPQEARTDAHRTVTAIARHLQIPVSESRAGKIAETAAAAAPIAAQSSASEEVRALPEHLRKMLDGALASYGEFFAGGDMGRIVWTRDLFALVDDATKKPAEAIDVSGGARCLIYGPYIHLPPGRWSARVVLGFSQDAAGHIFLVDACCGHRQLAATSFAPQAAGVEIVEVAFSMDPSPAEQLEIRVMVLSERAGGHLAFGNVTLTPLALPHLESTTQYNGSFEAVLDL